MKRLTSAIVATGFFLLAGTPCGNARAQTPSGSEIPADFTYYLSRFAVAGTNPIVYLWTIKSPQNEAVRLDGVAFKSLSSPALRKWIIDWQQGSVPITYIAEKRPAGKADTAASERLNQEIAEFAQFCRSRKEPFIIQPAPK